MKRLVALLALLGLLVSTPGCGARNRAGPRNPAGEAMAVVGVVGIVVGVMLLGGLVSDCERERDCTARRTGDPMP